MKLNAKTIMSMSIIGLVLGTTGGTVLGYKLGKIIGEETGAKDMFMNWFGALCELHGLTVEEALKRMQ